MEKFKEWKSDLENLKQNFGLFNKEFKENIKSQNQRIEEIEKKVTLNIENQDEKFQSLENKINSLTHLISEYMDKMDKINGNNTDKKKN